MKLGRPRDRITWIQIGPINVIYSKILEFAKDVWFGLKERHHLLNTLKSLLWILQLFTLESPFQDSPCPVPLS
jgi:hypothetical protein